MIRFSHGAVAQIPTTSETVYAFRIDGHLDADAAEAMAEYMNDAFDRHDSVNMLLDLSGFTGSDWDSMLDDDVLESRFRALSSVGRYAVVGAPDRASRMIGFMNRFIPVEARTFDADDISSAWAFVDPESRSAA
ncbi:STAS/SEC14 domain-containing protein [uncultured Roseobacter sp.]|uniref:STAS/SEC14 domain-containing protein n=1 Tax=uncultured Roseobacter sp. TaxID=114847 RepID=UPI002633920F|nr:STAS/SEC14 domain-containing protein [uncultured Roseobacter sp.]